jgi:hypothetical protein
MFSFLKNGDMHNTIRTLTGFSGLSSTDFDRIKYSALNHSITMRGNVAEGRPIFTNIRQLEAEIETRNINGIASGRVPSIGASIAAEGSSSSRCPSSSFVSDDIHHDNAVLALIMAKELAFLNRTIQMISLITSRYQEEQADAQWGQSGIETADELGGEMSDDDDDRDNEEPMTPRCGLHRAGSHESQNDTHTSDKNQLVSTFLVGSGHLRQKFINLCQLAGTEIVLVNAMTTMDRPHSAASFEKQRHAEKLVLSDIYLEFAKYDAEHRSAVVWAFLELRDISVDAWRMMSMLAFCNLFRLTEGTDFAIYNQEDAIFSRGRDYTLFPLQHSAWPAEEASMVQEEMQAEAMDFDDDTVESSIRRVSSISSTTS